MSSVIVFRVGGHKGKVGAEDEQAPGCMQEKRREEVGSC